MREVILDHDIVEDTYTLCTDALTLAGVDEAIDLIVPPALWLAERERLMQRSGKCGLWLETSESPEAVANDLPHLDLVVVHFAAFTDGRGHSTARLLRERYHYRHELRAAGDVFKETLYYLSRCGFNAFALRPGESLTQSLSGLDVFSEAYQTSVERQSPLFRRRLAQVPTEKTPS
ncbi:MAG: DUF934 domain-containing protein [Ferrovum sp.]|nr:DUF934 domain-containing protein [Ferrovum sp.]